MLGVQFNRATAGPGPVAGGFLEVRSPFDGRLVGLQLEVVWDTGGGGPDGPTALGMNSNFYLVRQDSVAREKFPVGPTPVLLPFDLPAPVGSVWRVVWDCADALLQPVGWQVCAVFSGPDGA